MDLNSHWLSPLHYKHQEILPFNKSGQAKKWKWMKVGGQRAMTPPLLQKHIFSIEVLLEISFYFIV